jgi:hypothetical protein
MSRHGHTQPSSLPVESGERQYLFDKPRNVRLFFRLLYVACAVLLLLDVVVHRHVTHPWDRLWGFYPIYGFIGVSFLVLAAKQLRKVVKRPEDYYDAD